MKKYIITESEFNAEILKKILPENDYSILGCWTRSSALSKAKSMLISYPVEIVLVLDAQMISDSGFNEKKDFVECYMGGYEYKSFYFRPSIENIFLEVGEIFEGKNILNFLGIGIFEFLNGRENKKLCSLLTTDVINEIKEKSAIKDLIELLK